ncbi:hypothetical protein AAG747_14325 [Rapidithrix thailandica]|uniref:Lipoprotein n=1 Tax=Rapidithrix thailandica TaxID=413964 RepID=A0AAW9SBE1_9BACT
MQKLKFFVYALFITPLLLTSCSKDDDDPQPAKLEDVKFALKEDFEEITAPQNLQKSEDPNAQQVLGYIQQANSFKSYMNFFTIPEGAEKSNTPINAAGGRVTSGEYLVYKWSYDGLTIAYQVSQQGNEYVFEAFINDGEGSSTLVKYIEARQSTDGKKGSMKVFDFYDLDDNGKLDDVTANYIWEHRDNGSIYFKFDFGNDALVYELEVNADASGKVQYYIEGELYYFVEWDAQGNGSWKYYSEGKVVESDSWTV